MKTTHLDLDERDLRLLVQSLENCLRTCEAKKRQPDAPCEDCDAALALKHRIEAALRA